MAKTEGWKRSERGRPSVEEEQRRVGERRGKGGRDTENGGGIGGEWSMLSHFTLTAGAIYSKSYLLIVLRSAVLVIVVLYCTVLYRAVLFFACCTVMCHIASFTYTSFT